MDELQEAKGWLIDCFPDDEEAINDSTDAQIWQAVERHYEGGVAAFKESLRPPPAKKVFGSPNGLCTYMPPIPIQPR